MAVLRSALCGSAGAAGCAAGCAACIWAETAAAATTAATAAVDIGSFSGGAPPATEACTEAATACDCKRCWCAESDMEDNEGGGEEGERPMKEERSLTASFFSAMTVAISLCIFATVCLSAASLASN